MRFFHRLGPPLPLVVFVFSAVGEYRVFPVDNGGFSAPLHGSFAPVPGPPPQTVPETGQQQPTQQEGRKKQPERQAGANYRQGHNSRHYATKERATRRLPTTGP